MPRHSLYALLRFTICFLVTFAFSYDFPTFAVFHPTWFLMSFLYLLVVSSFSSCFLSILFSSCFLFSALFQEQISKDKLDFSYLSPDIHSWNAYLSGNLFFLLFPFLFSAKEKEMVGTNGLEPSTSRLSGVRSNHLSYAPGLVEMRRIELLTPCLQSRCSPSWATPPLPYFFFFQSSVFFPVSSKLNNVFLYFPTSPSHWPFRVQTFLFVTP